jgi:hypothetical protein
MNSSGDARQMAALLRISESLDIVGDVSVTVANPAELLAWANTLPGATIFAWRGHVSGKRFVHVTAVNGSNPVHGRVTAALRADQHTRFWKELIPEGDLEPGDERTVTAGELAQAWEAMPVDLPDAPPDREEEEI